MRQHFSLVVLVIALWRCFTVHAELLTAKAVCVPEGDGYTKVGEVCGLLRPPCASPAECDIDSATCKVQELYAGATCKTNRDCYAVNSLTSQVTPALKCLASKCKWMKGLGDSCELDDQCPVGVPCNKGKCAALQKGDRCAPVADIILGSCGNDLYCKSSSLSCQPFLDNGEECTIGSECKSGYCFGSKCVAQQNSEGGSCMIGLLGNNCNENMYCDSENKCRNYAGRGDLCEPVTSDLSKFCNPQSGIFCYKNQCVDRIACETQSDCSSIAPELYCLCNSKKCTSPLNLLSCTPQYAKAEVCMTTKCRRFLTQYTFAVPDSCYKRKCLDELVSWHDCHKVSTKSEYGVADAYIGGASMTSVGGWIVVPFVIISLFSNL